MKKICYIATNNFAIENFLKNLIQKVSEHYKVIIICSGASKFKKVFKKKNIVLYDVNIERKINLIKDFSSLLKIILILRKEKVDIAHSIMPKTGLLVSIAGIISGTKIRIHTFTGQIWCNLNLFKKFFFIKIDELIILLNNYIFVDSFGQKKFLEDNLNHRKKLKVIGNGSISGFDLKMFKEKKLNRLLFKKDKINILFVGRINKDKGIFNLIEAFENLKYKFNIRLIVSGTIDDMKIKENFLTLVKKNNILWLRNKPEIKKSYLISDIFCLPSYREGFGNSVIEANIAKLPVLITDIYGFGDIIKNKLYSRKCIPNDSNDLKKNLEKILINLKKYKSKSKKNFFKIKKLYDQKMIINEYYKFYKSL